jgi:hypothetical protein
MKKTVWMSAAILAFGISINATAQSEQTTQTDLIGNCSYPDRPTIADGNTATEAEMIESQKGMKDYLAKGNEFLACIDQEEAALTANTDITPELAAENKARLTQTYNAVVDDMNAVAESFNTSLRAFKSKAQ